MEEPFHLQQPKRERKPLNLVLSDNTRQGVLFTGSDCLRGQQELFDPNCEGSASMSLEAQLTNRVRLTLSRGKWYVSRQETEGAWRHIAGPGAEQVMSDQLRVILAADPSLSCWPPEVVQAGRYGLPSEEA